ncbi:MAG: cell division protein FtsX [Alphaproteobacteria bacterium]
MLRRRSPLPLHEDAANRFLPWIVALMVYLAALSLDGALAIDGAVARWRGSQDDTLTVQVPPGDDATRDAPVTAVLEVLRATPGVAAARPLERDELVALLEPWLGKGNVAPDLPLPWLIDVTLVPEAALDPLVLETRLQVVAPGTEIDDSGIWLERLTAAARSLQAVALAVVLAIGAAAVGTVVFTTRTSLAVHHDTIEVLHLIGAHDAFVARVFARQALWLGLRGGVLGLSLAALTGGAVWYFAGDIDAPLLPRLALTPAGWGALAALPLVSALVAMLTARVTVMRALARMP